MPSPATPAESKQPEPLTAEEILGPLYVALATLERRGMTIKVMEMDLRDEKAKSERLEAQNKRFAAKVLDEQAVTKNWIGKCSDLSDKHLCLRERLHANALSLAGATTELIDERDTARRDLKDMTEDRDNCLQEVRAYHFEYGPKDCEGCGGKGKRVEYVHGTTNDITALEPPEHPVEVECEECRGSTKKWGV